MFRKALLTFGAILLLIVSVAPAASQSDSTGQVRFVNVIPGAGAVDVYVDGQLTLLNQQFGTSSLYIPVAAGPHTVTVTQTGVTTPLWQQDIAVAAGSATTYVASSTDPLGFQAFEDDLNPLPLGKARLTALHAIAGGPTVDIVLSDGRAVIPGLQYGVPYGTLDVPAGVYEVAVVPTGESVENAVIPVTPLKLDSSTSYIVVAYGTLADPAVLVLSAATRPEDAANFTGGFARLVHAVPGAPAVDVFINDTLVAPSVEFGEATDYLALAAGDYPVAVHVAGETEPLFEATLTVDSDTYATTAVLGSVENISAQTFTDDLAGIGPQAAVLSVINAQPDGSVSVTSGDGQSLLTDVAAGVTGTTTIAPVSTTLTISTDTSTATTDLTGVIYGGVYYSAIVVAGDSSPEVVSLPPASIAMSIDSAPGDQTISTAAPTVAPTEAAAAPTEAPAAVETPVATVAPVATAAPVASGAGPTARVLTDPGVNVHLRQYPSSQALSLALVPSGTIVDVLGRPGEPTFPVGVTVTPDPSATPFVDPATLLVDEDEDLDPAETWLFVDYTAPDGGSITGWVNSVYLGVIDENGEPVRLADLPLVPINQAGEASTTFVPTPLPTQPFEDVVVATVDQLNAGANLHLRRNPSQSAESLALIPSGTQLVVEGQNDTGEWYQVTYEGITGWISSAYVSLTFNGRTFDQTSVPVLATPTPTPTVEPTPGA